MEDFNRAIQELTALLEEGNNAQNYLAATFYLRALIIAMGGAGPLPAPPVPNTFGCPHCSRPITYHR